MTDFDRPTRDYTRQSSLADASSEFFRRYFDFQGRSNRGEFWWWVLASLIISVILGITETVLFGIDGIAPLTGLFGLATLIPNIALGIRRLHDIDRTGWWVLLALIPVLGALILAFAFYIHKPDPHPNRFG